MRVADFTSNHYTDAEGLPDGGTSDGLGFTIVWQRGPRGRARMRIPRNGATVEDILMAALDRLDYYQGGRFQSVANENASHHIREALSELRTREQDRKFRDQGGTNEL